jgi:hypothetical protein
MERLDRDVDHAWHKALNQVVYIGDGIQLWMYEAKRMAVEVPRLKRLFELERTGTLPKYHRQCSHQEPVEIDNYLMCCLGIECRKCDFLKAFDQVEVNTEQLDEIKAWTCATHIVSQSQMVDTSEGYILTTSDRMFWSKIYESLAGAYFDDEGLDELPEDQFLRNAGATSLFDD